MAKIDDLTVLVRAYFSVFVFYEKTFNEKKAAEKGLKKRPALPN